MDSTTLAAVFGLLAVLSSAYIYLFSRPAFPRNAPALTSEAFPVIGSLQFFTKRWDFFQKAMAQSSTGNFSFYAGQYPIIGVAGPEARKVFLENKGLAFAEGYAAMLGGSPKVKKEAHNPFSEDAGGESGFSKSSYHCRGWLSRTERPSGCCRLVCHWVPQWKPCYDARKGVSGQGQTWITR